MTELIVGKFYKNKDNGKKRKLVAIEEDMAVFFSKEDTIVFMRHKDDDRMFEEWEEEKPPVEFDPQGLQFGLYRIFWKDGGNSLASIGNDRSGKRWMAPCNWVSGSSTDNWRGVSSVECILSVADNDREESK